jgi:hypothetical protein
MLKNLAKIILIFAFAGAASACGYAYYTHANPFDYFHFKPQPKPNPPAKHKLDLKVSSVCHYFQDGVDVGCQNNGQTFGNWPAQDLNCRSKFFNFNDLKPGDSGEDTIDLTVSGGEACGTMSIENILDRGNRCTEPETKMQNDRDCRHQNPGVKERDGEMRENLDVRIWLDQGRTLGFQGKSDPGEGDNIFNENDAMMMDWTNLKKCPKTFELRKFLRNDRQKFWNDCERFNPDGDGKKCKNKVCHGVARDGRLLEGVTYYIGFAWRLPPEAGNEVQTDSLKFDVKFTARDNASCQPCTRDWGRCED